MAAVYFHKNIHSFWEQNEGYFDANMYAVEPLVKMIAAHHKKQVKITAAFNIDEFNCDVCGIWTHPFLMIYGNKWEDVSIRLLTKALQLENMQNCLVSGQRELVLSLLDNVPHPKSVISERNVYECHAIADVTKVIEGALNVADFGDLDQIADMSYQFQKEEYGDRSNKSYEEMKNEIVLPGLIAGNFLKWTDQGKIRSVLQFSIENNAPSIGHFFTGVQSRNKGYGYALLWNATNKLLQKYTRCGLLAKRDYQPSNAVFLKTGYKNVYDWIKIHVAPA